MKKKILVVMLGICMAATALSGCGKKEEEKTSKERGVDKLRDQVLEDVDKYATPGQYKGVKAEAEDLKEITDADVETDLQGWLQYYPVVFEGSVVSGQSANIDYKGTIDGKEFEGGSGEGYELQQVGSGTFIPGFEEQLIGMNVSDTKTIDVTFPSDYTNTELAGKSAAFEVTVNSVQGTATLSKEWIDYVVKQEGISEDDLKEHTPEKFKEFVRSQLEKKAESTRKSTIVQQVLATVTQNTTFKDIPDDLKNQYIEDEKTYQENYITNSYGMTLDDYFTQAGITEDDFNKQIEEDALEYMNNVLALKAIAIKEKIKLSEKEYEDVLQSYADQYGMDSVEAFEEQYEDQYGTDLFEGALLEKVLDFIVDNADVTAPSNVSGDAVTTGDGAAVQ